MTPNGGRNARWWFIAIVAFVLVAILAAAVATDSSLARFDRAVAKTLDEHTTLRWVAAFRTITLLGTGWALGIASAIVAIGLLFRRRFLLAIGWIVAQGGAAILVKIVKVLVERDRPGLGDVEFYAHGWSFPSGHVVRTAVFCGMAAYLVFRLSGSRSATAVACVLGLAWSLVMCFSRLYLGAHFLTDVTAGLILATGWVSTSIAGIERREAATP